MSIFDKFNSQIDVAGLAKDAKEAGKSTGGNYVKVPHGTYEVTVKKMELKESKAGKPMVAIQFKVLKGEHAKGVIFYNQVITQGFQVHLVNEMLRKLCNNRLDVDFEDYEQYNDLLLDVFEITGEYEYALKYTAGKGNFDEYEITEVFELE